jgi:alpha-galactosidase
MSLKIAVIGGGSYNWAPTIINDVLSTDGLEGSHIVLEDISPEPLEVIHKLGDKIIADKKADCRLSSTTDEAEALEGADFVVTSISTGGFETMEKDLEIPLRYGVNQTVGDSVGPGGLARALRSIPVQIGIAKHMETLCPDAWLVNITNPMATICLATVQMTSIKTVGLCHELQGVLAILKSMLQLPEDVPMEMQVAGINHFIWLLSLQIDGGDGFDTIRDWMQNPTPFEVPDQEAKEMFAPSLIDAFKLKLALLEKYGYLPAAGDRHICEFFDSYLADIEQADRLYGIKPTAITERRDSWFAAMRGYVHGMLEGNFPLPGKKSSEAISDVIAALAGKIPGIVDIINIPNAGQIANLPQGALVETLGRVSSDGAEGKEILELPAEINKLILPHAENQSLIVKAAVDGDRKAAREMLARDPLTRNCSDIDKMLDELLAAHSDYLPQFR